MLQITPDKKNTTETAEKPDDAIYCAGCRDLVTRTRWKISLGGSERVFTNPMGLTFNLVCFSEAPGAAAEGEATDDHTWFPGYFWNFALCRGCVRHLGWFYRRDSGGDAFFGLIKGRITGRPG